MDAIGPLCGHITKPKYQTSNCWLSNSFVPLYLLATMRRASALTTRRTYWRSGLSSAVLSPSATSLGQCSPLITRNALSLQTVAYDKAPYAYDTPYSPAVLALIHQHRLTDPRRIPASGPKGRLLKGDILAFLAGGSKVPPQQQRQTAAPKAVPPPKLAAAYTAAKVAQPPRAQTQASGAGEFEDIPNSNIRKVIASRLTESKWNIPHQFISADCEIDTLLKTRSQINAQSSTKVSVNDFVIRALALALRDVPEANASWSDSAIRRYHTVDVSVAVATDKGLITPVIRNADAKGLAEIANEVRDLAGRARDGRLKPEEYQGGTASVSNLGMFGVTEFSAVINPPQGCILAVGTGRKVVSTSAAFDPDQEAAFVDEEDEVISARKAEEARRMLGSMKEKTMLAVTLSCDNRAIGTDVAGRLLAAFRQYIENPEQMFVGV